MTTTQVTLTGIADLKKALRALPAVWEQRVLKSAVRAGARELAKEIRQFAPRRGDPNHPYATGALRKSVRVRARARSGKVRSGVYFRGRRMSDKGTEAVGSHWALLEFGTVRQPAKPFVRPAFDAAKHRALKGFIEEARRQAPKAIERVQRQNRIKARVLRRL